MYKHGAGEDLSAGSRGGPNQLGLQNHMRFFDGTQAHETEEFEGERFVIIAYCNNR